MKKSLTGLTLIMIMIFSFVYVFDLGGPISSSSKDAVIDNLRGSGSEDVSEIINDENFNIQSKTSAIPVGWTYQSHLSINPVVPENSYQIKLILTTDNFDYSLAASDGKDIRFHDINDNPLNYWIETWDPSGKSVIWINVPLSGTSEINMFYGNPSATFESNGDLTFEFFDDFPGSSIDPTKWTTETDAYSTMSVSGSIVSLSTDTPSDNAPSVHLGFSDFYVDHGAPFGAKAPNGVTIGAHYGRGNSFYTRSPIGEELTLNTLNYEEWYTSDIRWISNSLAQNNNGSYIVTHTNSTIFPIIPLQVRILTMDMYAGPGTWFGQALQSTGSWGAGHAIRARSWHDGVGAPEIQCDWVVVRKCVDQEPSVSLINPININSPKDQYSSSLTPGHYPASYSFESDQSFPYTGLLREGLPTQYGQPPEGWIPHYPGQFGRIRVIDGYMGHTKVVEMTRSWGSFGKTRTGLTKYFPTSSTSGTIEFWHNKNSDTDYDATEVILLGTGGSIQFGVENQALYRGVYASRINISEYVFPKDTWKHISVDFDVGQGGWQISLDGILYGSGYAFPFEGSPTEITGFDIRTHGTDLTTALGYYHFYFDALGYSWDPFYNIGDNLAEGLLVDFEPIQRSRSDWEGYYPASQGFDEIPQNGQPDNWGYWQGGSSYVEDSRSPPELYVLDANTDSFGNTHNRVLYCKDNAGGTVFVGAGEWEEAVSSGTYEFWMSLTNNQYATSWGLLADNSSFSYTVFMAQDAFASGDPLLIWDGDGWLNSNITFSQNKWYRFSVDFSDDGTYAGLAPHHYRVRWFDSDGTSLIFASQDVQFRANGSSIGIHTQTGDSTQANLYYDAFGYSWDPNYNIGDNRFPGVYEGPELAESTWIGYSIDSTANVTIDGDSSIVPPCLGEHDIQIYYGDTYGTAYRSEVRSFLMEGSINIDTPENITYETAMSGYYPASWGFEHNTPGIEPSDWFLLPPSGSSFYRVNAEYGGRKDVLEVRKIGGTTLALVKKNFTTTATSGTVEFWLQKDTDNLNDHSRMYLLNSTGGILLTFYVQNGNLYYDDAWNGILLASNVMPIDTWHHIRIDFDISQGGYQLHFDGTLYGSGYAFPFEATPNHLDAATFQLCSIYSGDYPNYASYLDALGYSWDPGYTTGDNLNEGLLLNYSYEPLKDGHYPGTYSFETDLNGAFPEGFYGTSAGAIEAWVIEEFNGHKKVLRAYDGSGTGAWSMGHYMNVTEGTAELWMASGTTVTNRPVSFGFHPESVDPVLFGVSLYEGNIRLFDLAGGPGGYGTTIGTYSINSWQHLRFDFRTNSSITPYSGLNPNQFKVYLNGTEIGIYDFQAIGDLFLTRLYSLYTYSGITGYYDAIGYSWENYTIGSGLSEGTIDFSYSLDGQAYIPIDGNHTIPLPTTGGSHTIQLLGIDYLGNYYRSDVRTFGFIPPTPPSISGPSDFSIYFSATGYSILWTVTDDYPANYTVYRNGTIFDTGTWTDSVIIWLDGLVEGRHNFTCVVQNTYQKFSSDEVWIAVLPAAPDTTPPTISSPPDITFEEGSIGYGITWTGSDLRPWWSSVWKNGSLIYDQSWTPLSDEITINLAGLSKGNYNYTCTLFDEASNSVRDTVWITVLEAVPDTDAPIIFPPLPIMMEEGAPGHTLFWYCSDAHPFAYQILVNETGFPGHEYKPWHGENISISLDDLNVGIWIFNLTLWDLSGNSTSTEVTVTVIPEAPDIDPPSASTPAELVITENMPGTIIWEVSDKYPRNYMIIQNGTQIYTQDHWGSGIIQYHFTFLPLGTWYFDLLLWDMAGNSYLSTAIVKVLPGSEYDTNPPEISHVEDQNIAYGSTGVYVIVYLFDEHPQGYSIFISTVTPDPIESSWTITNIQVELSLDGLAIGSYTVNITAWDVFGNSDFQIFLVEVTGDNTPPDITPHPDITAYSNTTVKITWAVTDDKSPSHWELINLTSGDPLTSGTWSGNQIQVELNNLPVGTYKLQLRAYDSSGNYATDDVTLVIIKAKSTPGFELFSVLFLLLVLVIYRKGATCKRRIKK